MAHRIRSVLGRPDPIFGGYVSWVAILSAVGDGLHHLEFRFLVRNDLTAPVSMREIAGAADDMPGEADRVCRLRKAAPPIRIFERAKVCMIVRFAILCSVRPRFMFPQTPDRRMIHRFRHGVESRALIPALRAAYAGIL